MAGLGTGVSVRPGQVYYFSSFLTLKKTSFALFGIPVLSCFKLRSSTLLQGILADLQRFSSKTQWLLEHNDDVDDRCKSTYKDVRGCGVGELFSI